MNEELTDKAEEIFCSALKTRTPEQRNHLLERECGGNGALRLLVEELLAVQPEVNQFFKSFPDSGVVRLPVNQLAESLEKRRLDGECQRAGRVG